jgi:hypothetical protein
MQDSEKDRFLKLFVEMASCYPSQQIHSTHAEAYWLRLKSYPIAAVRVGLVRAAGDGPKFFPTAIAVEDHTKAAAKNCDSTPDYELRAITGATQSLHGLPPTNRFEQLARKWERENLIGNPDCSHRAAELIAAFEGVNGPIAHDLVPAVRDWKNAAAGEREDEAA